MIYSMTAFGRSQTKKEWGVASWEIRSINHRYLDFNIRLPDTLRDLEQHIREIAQEYFQRGKIECTLRFMPGSNLGATLSVNRGLLHQLIILANDIKADLPEKIISLNLIDLLSWNGVVEEESFDLGLVRDDLLNLFREAAQDLKEGRKREGATLTLGIQAKLTEIIKQVTEIKSYLPKIIERQREKIIYRLEEAKVALDQQRLEQEMIYFVQKMDVTEEIERTLSHINEVQRTLEKGDSAGRRLDFMMQELNREANTLASKSVEPQVTHAAVEMKVLIEQIREQVQNIE
ncbi:MAG: YicC family protein [Gammaproteobacteria bacterium]|nr:YicC family protein [Gammaproteobacteria bacterium]